MPNRSTRIVCTRVQWNHPDLSGEAPSGGFMLEFRTPAFIARAQIGIIDANDWTEVISHPHLRESPIESGQRFFDFQALGFLQFPCRLHIQAFGQYRIVKCWFRRFDASRLRPMHFLVRIAQQHFTITHKGDIQSQRVFSHASRVG